MTSEEIEQQDEIGTILQKARLERGENLSQVSNNLRIRQVYLEAIENNQFDRLPGIIYVVGFIRSYSEYLNLDAEGILKKYKESTDAVDKKQDLHFPAFVPENSLPGSAILLVGLMIAFFGYASWYFLSNQNQFEINKVQHIPSELETLTQKDEKNKNVSNKINESSHKFKPQDKKQIISETNNQKLEAKIKKTIKEENSPSYTDENSTIKTIDSKISATKEDSDTADVGAIKSSKVKVVGPKIKKVEIQETSSASQSLSNRESNISEINETPEIGVQSATTENRQVKEKILTETNIVEIKPKEPSTELSAIGKVEKKIIKKGKSRINIVAVTDSYIQVRDNTNSRLLVTRLLKKSQSYEVPNRPNLSLITGNAGALQIFVDGALAPSIGPIGKVRRNVILDADKLKDGQAVLE